MRFAVPWIIAFVCALPGLAPADELTPEKQADIRQLIGVTGAKLPAQLADATTQA